MHESLTYCEKTSYVGAFYYFAFWLHEPAGDSAFCVTDC